MIDQNSPNDPPESEDADDIIELTDVVASPASEGEDIIELTDVVEAQADEDEDVIDLTDVVPSPPEETSPAEEEEPVIELTDVVALEEGDQETEPLEDRFEPADDEDVMVGAAVEGVEESSGGDLAFADMELDIEERKEEGLFDSLGMNMEADLLETDDDTSELDFNLSTQELSDAIDLLDAKLAEEPRNASPADADDIASPDALKAEQLETALENVIRKMFGEKIDQLLNEAIEKTVTAEIARLKEQLLGDETPDKS